MFTSATLSGDGRARDLKAELFQRTGSFKPRGVLTKLASLVAGEKARGRDRRSRPATTRRRSPTAPRSRGSTASSSCGRARARRRSPPRAATAPPSTSRRPSPGEAFDRLARAARSRRGRTLVHPFDDPLDDRRAGHGRARAARGRAGRRPSSSSRSAAAGSISGRRDRGEGAQPERARDRASSPRAPTRCAQALEAGRQVRIEPHTIADGLAAPFAGARLPRDLPRARRRASCSSARTRSRRACGSSTRARSSPASRPAAAAVAALLAGKVELAPRCARWLRRLGRQRGRRGRLCYPGRAMKADIHPEYVLATVTCSCGNAFETRSTKPELHVEICSNCHPFYTGKQKLMDTGGRVERFQRRLERAGQPRAISAGMSSDRRPGRPRGRDDARPVELGRRRAQARRRDRAGLPPDRVADGAAPALPAAGRPRRRSRSASRSRSGSARSPSPRTTPRRRRATRRARPSRRSDARAADLRVRRRDRASRCCVFKVGPALLVDKLVPVTSGTWFVIIEGPIRVTIFVALPVADLAAARPQARLPVPRGRAQGDQRLRGRRGADAGGRPALQPDPPPLRHRVPALGDGDRDLRLRVLRPAGLVLADRHPHPAAAA